MIWAASQRFGTMSINFVSNLVLARLLTPDDFGTIGMLAFFLAIANVFIETGFSAALIQQREVSNVDFSTVFYTNGAISILCYILLYTGAPFIAEFYNVEILIPLLRVEGIVLLTNALCIIQTTILRREMSFGKLAKANIIANLLGSSLAIVAALLNLGVWSLVVRAIAISLFTAIALWIINDWRPIIAFSITSIKRLFGFGGYMLMSTLLNTTASNLQSLLMGKLWNRSVLGYYTQAIQLRTVAADSISSVIGQVLYPDYSKHQHNNAEISRKLNFGLYIISYFTTAIMILLICCAEPLFSILYGDKWLPAVPYFRILCVGGIFYCIQDINYFVVAAKGKSRVLFYINLIKIPIYIVALILIGKLWGVTAFLWTIVTYSAVSYLLFAYSSTRELGTTMSRQLINIAKGALMSLVPMIITLVVAKSIITPSPWITLATRSSLFVATFLVLSVIIKPEPYTYLMCSIINLNNRHND